MNQLKVLGKEKVGKFEFTGIEGGFGDDKKAMMVKDIAEIHSKEVKVINQAINMNRKRFKDGIDIIDLKLKSGSIKLTEFFTKQQIANYKNIYILSERGYAKLLKILEDDTAWEIYDDLVDNYFAMRQATQYQPMTIEEMMIHQLKETALIKEDVKLLKTETTLNSSQKRKVNGLVRSTVIKVLGGVRSNAYKDSTIRTKSFSNCYKQLKDYFDVSSYMDIPKVRFEEAMELIPKWKPTLELQAAIDAANGNSDLFE